MKKSLFAVLHVIISCYMVFVFSACSDTHKNGEDVRLAYTVSMANPALHQFQIELNCNGGFESDTIIFKMPEWMPGYYQIMDYSDAVTDFKVADNNGMEVHVEKVNDHTWQAVIKKGASFKLSYNVKADRKFVANSYLDSTHAYIVPPSMFVYIDKHLDIPANIEIKPNNQEDKIVTGLENIPNGDNRFFAPNFDILYDCPILIGDLESLTPFYIDGIEHQFAGYKLGEFDKEMFMENLQKVVQSATEIIGEIPYKSYKFIAIGPGYGGIEHLNNTTVSFNGNNINEEHAFNGMMSFLAHEYFHHYNVKRIRPYELGPFEYDKENRTNLLWLSEGFTSYYENIIVKRAGLINKKEFFSNLSEEINILENDPGRHYQSLIESSYYTWEDGPFGNFGKGEDRSISYYVKGSIVGLILDLSIREATENQKSLDDVMRFLYFKYYKELQRGFTDAEFQQVCETIADTTLNPVFEYVYSTEEIDYDKYLAYAGLKLKRVISGSGVKINSIERMENLTPEQMKILYSWLGEE